MSWEISFEFEKFAHSFKKKKEQTFLQKYVKRNKLCLSIIGNFVTTKKEMYYCHFELCDNYNDDKLSFNLESIMKCISYSLSIFSHVNFTCK